MNIQQKKPWITSGIGKSSEKLKFLNRLIKGINVSIDLKNYYYNYKTTYLKVLTAAKKMYNNKKIAESINKSKSIWELINEETGKLKARYETINIKQNGEFISDPTNVAQLFNTYFTETAGKLQINFESEAIQHKVSKLNLLTSIFLTPTDDDEIISVIKELKNKKISGLDGISSSLIKKCYIHLIKPLTLIINLSLNTGEFPELLKIAKVRPLLKKGSNTK